MSFLQPLLALVTNHLVASAAVGGLTIAGGAVVVDHVVETPAAVVDVTGPAAEQTDPEGEEDAAAEGHATAEKEASTDPAANGRARTTDTPDDAGGRSLANGDSDEDEDAQDRSDAVRAVIEGDEVQPGSAEFGRAVANAASEGRSEQRGRSAEARENNAADAADDGDDTGDDNEADAASEAGTRPAAPNEDAVEGRARAEANKQAAHEKRDAAKDRRPAPGDEVDETSTSGRG